MLALVGFLPSSDPRIPGTVAAIEQRLLIEGTFVLRYDSEEVTDGLPAGQGAFLACSFWLADNPILLGRHEEAAACSSVSWRYDNGVGLLGTVRPAGAPSAWQLSASLLAYCAGGPPRETWAGCKTCGSPRSRRFDVSRWREVKRGALRSRHSNRDPHRQFVSSSAHGGMPRNEDVSDCRLPIPSGPLRFA